MSKVLRHKTNPFTTNMVIPVANQNVKLSRLGEDDNVLVNQNTGEIQGTHITTYRKVDSEQFVKLFTQNIALTFGLSSAGIKAFSVLIFAVQHTAIAKDQVYLDGALLEDFLLAHSHREPPLKLSRDTLKRGIRELIKAQIIARTTRPGAYFLNPSFVFNGDRIAFTTMLERKTTAEEEQADLDLTLPQV